MKYHNDYTKSNISSSGCGLCCTRIDNFGVVRNKSEILKDVNLHIHCGDLTAIIGGNGAGKSTLLKAIIGEIPHSGKMSYLDANNKNSRKPIIGYVPQKLDFDISSPVSVLDLFAASLTKMPIWFSHTKNTRNLIASSLSNVNAEHLINRRLGELSGGELQRVMLALALVPIPDLLLMDEPVSGIDHSGLQMFYKTVSELRTNFDLSIILVSHDFNLVSQYADRVVFIDNKTVAFSGTPAEVFSNSQVVEKFGAIILPDKSDENLRGDIF